jgi:hypothetical protein
MRFRSTPALACTFAEDQPTNHGLEHKWTVQDIPSQEGRLAVMTQDSSNDARQ